MTDNRNTEKNLLARLVNNPTADLETAEEMVRGTGISVGAYEQRLKNMKLDNILIYDNGGATMDRYTVVFMDQPEGAFFSCLGMNESPFSPSGFCQHSVAACGDHLGKRIKFSDLPVDCQKAVKQELE